MRFIGTKRIVFLLLTLFSTSQVSAQYQSNFSLGLGSVRGDMQSSFYTLIGFGPYAQYSYLKQINQSPIWYGGTASYLFNQQRRSINGTAESLRTYINMHHLFIGPSIKAYLTGSNTLDRRKGAFLPFISISAGADLFLNSVVQNIPNPPFEIQEGFGVSPTVMVGAGFEYSFSRDLTISGSGAMRAGFNDYWDGIKGTGPADDLILNLELGLIYILGVKEVF